MLYIEASVIFEEPLMFDPERFENGTLKGIPKFFLFPIWRGEVEYVLVTIFAMLEAVLVFSYAWATI
ncbi:hypothetical protein GCM10020331_101820 [Ectobacillus funiculus]